MNIKKLIAMLEHARSQDIDDVDLVLLYAVGTAPDGEGTIMKIMKSPGSFSQTARHHHMKKLCKREFLVRKEVPNNQRKKTLELSDKAVEFLKSLERVGNEII